MKVPTLKQGSGGPFNFEDQVAATLACEMLAAKNSLSLNEYRIIRIERSATDWEPFGDLLVTVVDREGSARKVGCSIKSSRLVTGKGGKSELVEDIWNAFDRDEIKKHEGELALFSKTLGQDASDLLHSLLRQAKGLTPQRLSERIEHNNLRVFHDSFTRPGTTENKETLPGHILGVLNVREFDFEATHSRDVEAAVAICNDLVANDSEEQVDGRNLWGKILTISQDNRVNGWEIDVPTLVRKIGSQFKLKDFPSDFKALSILKSETESALAMIRNVLPGNFSLSRTRLNEDARELISKHRVLPILGESGNGKSGLAKSVATTSSREGHEVFWFKAAQIEQLFLQVPDLLEVLSRKNGPRCLLVLDSVEQCRSDAQHHSLSRLLSGLPTWQVILTCVADQWGRVIKSLELEANNSDTVILDCPKLCKEELVSVSKKFPAFARVLHQDPIRRVLGSLKRLEIFLRISLPPGKGLATEVDLIDCWWEHEIKNSQIFCDEETVATKLAIHLGDEYAHDVEPMFLAGHDEAVRRLVAGGVLQRDARGRFSFEHDLLADWSRFVHLKALGLGRMDFIAERVEIPSWLRALRLYSQSLCEEDLEQWLNLLNSLKDGSASFVSKGPKSEQFQDSWLEGLLNSRVLKAIPDNVATALLADDCYLFERLLARLLRTSTTADAQMVALLREEGIRVSYREQLNFRIPYWPHWIPVFKFVHQHAEVVVDQVPDLLAKVGLACQRFASSERITWSDFAEILVKNAENELFREVSMEYYRKSRAITGSFGSSSDEVEIYKAALLAASKCPREAIRFSRWASGLEKIPDARMPEDAGDDWKGAFRDYRNYLGLGQPDLQLNPKKWPRGRSVRGSRSFFKAWMQGSSSLPVFRAEPAAACEITFALLIEWPKTSVYDLSFSDSKEYGFSSQSDDCVDPFWTEGPFLSYLREDWEISLNLIIELINFATDRYLERWKPEFLDVGEELTEVEVSHDDFSSKFKGNYQVYGWGINGNGLPGSLVSSLVALEKWLEEQIELGVDVKKPIEKILKEGNSLAFAGTLNSLGKNHKNLFLGPLKSLLFHREFYLFELRLSAFGVGLSYGFTGPRYERELRKKWESRDSKKTDLTSFARLCFLEDADFTILFLEVAESWKRKSESFEEGSEKWLSWQRWACDFDRAFWKEAKNESGELFWVKELPPNLENEKEMTFFNLKGQISTMSYRFRDVLSKNAKLTVDSLEGIFSELKNWERFREVTKQVHKESPERKSSLDDRHGRMGLLAILLRFGKDWIREGFERLEYLDNAMYEIIQDPPQVLFYNQSDESDDYETFLATAIPHRLCLNGEKGREEYDKVWLEGAAALSINPRYHATGCLFLETYRCREELGPLVSDLEGFLVKFANTNYGLHIAPDEEARKQKEKQIENWRRQWIPRFVNREAFELETFRKTGDPSLKKDSHGRTVFDFEIARLVFAFRCLPSLSSARDESERERWVQIGRNFLKAYFDALPPMDSGERGFERFADYSETAAIFKICVRQFWDLETNSERVKMLVPLMNLPSTASAILEAFLEELLSEVFIRDPVPFEKIKSVWPFVVKSIGSISWLESKGQQSSFEIWKILLCYGTFASQWARVGEFAPVVNLMKNEYLSFANCLSGRPRDQGDLLAFVNSDAGKEVLLPIVERLSTAWGEASNFFWQQASGHRSFEELLELLSAELKKGMPIPPEISKAFRSLVLGLATQGNLLAINIQAQEEFNQ